MCTTQGGEEMKRSAIALEFIIISLMLFLITTSPSAGQKEPVRPSPRDKCPVCGMFVVKQPDFIAEIIFKDSAYAVFDGAKDMFKYYFNLGKYNPKRKYADIDAIYATDYYRLTFIDGYKAYYVGGSDVYGPMGRELISFGKSSDAEEFKRDHKGKAILQFKDITYDVIKGLD